jgi:TetR/AcrR family transcriptional regulator
MSVERIRDADATRESVLTAAEQLFAEHGFAATSMRDISSASGVSHPLIHHHFGSKKDLYDAVKRRLVEDYSKRFPHAARAVNRPLNVEAEMHRLLDYIGGNPMLLKLCARTQLEGDNQIWPGEPDILNTLRQRIEISQQRGLIRNDLCSNYISIMVLGLVYFWLQGREHFVHRFGDAVNDDHFIEQAIAMLEQGLAPSADAVKPTSAPIAARDEVSESME